VLTSARRNPPAGVNNAPSVGGTIWQELEEWPGYLINTLGHIYNMSTGHILTGTSRDGRCACLKRDGEFHHVRVARLVLITFRGPPPKGKPLACHRDDDQRNNRLSNLKWGNKRSNLLDARRNGREIYTDRRNRRISRSLKAFYRAGGKCR